MDDDKFDGYMLTIAQSLGAQGGINGLLDVYFSFLRRKTDFFSGGGGGIERVEAAVMGALRRQWDAVQRSEAEKEQAKQKAAAKAAKAAAAAAAAAAPKPASDAAGAAVAPAAAAAAAAAAGGGGSDSSSGSSSGSSGSAAAAAPAPSPAAPAAGGGGGGEAEAAAPAAGGAPVGPGNGGTTDRYSWTQTLSEVCLSFPVPRDTKGKDVALALGAEHLRLAVGKDVLFDASLHKRARVGDPTWTFEDNQRERTRALVLTIDKENGMEWWSCVGVGHPAIDVTKVEPENSKLGDVDGETRKTVEKMMFDQAQKARGLPTSDVLTKQDTIAMFMKAHPE